MQRDHSSSSKISDVAQTVNLLVTRTVEALHKSRSLWDGTRHARVDTARINAARAENASLPISRLPAEVFLLCVDHYLEMPPAGHMGDMKSYRRLQTLSSVCWSWKCTILHTPALWSSLQGPPQSDEHAKLCLSRAANHPLAIDFHLRGGSLREFDKRILPNLGRCSTLSLQVDTQFELLGWGPANSACVSAFDRFKRAQMPLLEYLYLCGRHANIPDVDIFALHPESPLKRVDLQSWRNLTFATPPRPTLKHFSMRDIKFDCRIKLDPSQLFAILSQLPALEHLEICGVDLGLFADTTLAPILSGTSDISVWSRNPRSLSTSLGEQCCRPYGRFTLG